jgi:hypothetical protein
LGVLALTRANAADLPKPVQSLRVVYVGTAGTERARAYAQFLGDRFTLIQAADRDRFDPSAAAGADVVILDWSQQDARPAASGRGALAPERALKSPLGERAHWAKPTVLLGSAGLLLAMAWEVHGGSG